MDQKITVLRLGHRFGRDERITTHCGLVSRAFGASNFILSGDEDHNVLESLKKVTEQWGGPFEVSYKKNWKSLVENFDGLKVHLTMYGIPVQKKINEIKKQKNILLIIGGEKVPSEIYHLVDYNISITSQPHSEVAALSVFLHEFFSGKELNKKFKNSKIKIVPQERGKKLIS